MRRTELFIQTMTRHSRPKNPPAHAPIVQLDALN